MMVIRLFMLDLRTFCMICERRGRLASTPSEKPITSNQSFCARVWAFNCGSDEKSVLTSQPAL